jgi:hypothetical protein
MIPGTSVCRSRPRSPCFTTTCQHCGNTRIRGGSAAVARGRSYYGSLHFDAEERRSPSLPMSSYQSSDSTRPMECTGIHPPKRVLTWLSPCLLQDNGPAALCTFLQNFRSCKLSLRLGSTVLAFNRGRRTRSVPMTSST